MQEEKISEGPNEAAVGETIAGTGPGIPDEAVGEGQQLPEPPTDQEVAAAAIKLNAPLGGKSQSQGSPPGD